jgi:hypothetical protein
MATTMATTIILFPGFSKTKHHWTRKFLSLLKPYGNVFTYTPEWHNTSYYDKKNKERKFYKSSLNFGLNDLKLKPHCEFIHSEVFKAFKKTKRIILISHSAGNYFALKFSKMYKCFIHIQLDPTYIGGTLVSKYLLSMTKNWPLIKNKKHLESLKKTVQSGGSQSELDMGLLRKIIEQKMIIRKFSTRTIMLRNIKSKWDNSFKQMIFQEIKYFYNYNKDFKCYTFLDKSHDLYLDYQIQNIIKMILSNL